MIEDEFEDFEDDKNKRKNMRMIIDFSSSNILHNGKEFTITPPKLKDKYKSSVYIKNNNKGNSLF